MPTESLSPRALVVDDEPGVRLFARRVLERSGWAVDEAVDGWEALERLVNAGDAPHYDLVLSDIRMPRLDGLQMYAELASRRPELLPRLVLYSGTLSDPGVQDFLRRTPVPALAKPFGPHQLIAAADAARQAGASS